VAEAPFYGSGSRAHFTSDRRAQILSGTPYALSIAASSLPAVALGVVSGDAPPGEVAGAPPGLPATVSHHPQLAYLFLQFIRIVARVTQGFTVDRGTAMLSDTDRGVVSEPSMRRGNCDLNTSGRHADGS